MAVSLLLIYRAARFFGLQVDRRALVLCAFMAVGVNFASIFLSNVLTLDHLLVIIGLVLLAAALVTIFNEYLLRHQTAALVGVDAPLSGALAFATEVTEDTEISPAKYMGHSEASEPPLAAPTEKADEPSPGKLSLLPAETLPAKPKEATLETSSLPNKTEDEKRGARQAKKNDRDGAKGRPSAFIDATEALVADARQTLKTHRASPKTAAPFAALEIKAENVSQKGSEKASAVLYENVDGESGADLAAALAASFSAKSESTVAISPNRSIPTVRATPARGRSAKRQPGALSAKASRGINPAKPSRKVISYSQEPLPDKTASVGVALSRLHSLDDHLDYAFEQKSRRRFTNAILAYRQALEKFRNDPYSPFIAIELGNIYKETGAYADAISIFRNALQLPAIKGQDGIRAEFQKNIAYLGTVLHILTRHRRPNTPFSEIPPDCQREIESAFAAEPSGKYQRTGGKTNDQKKRRNP